MKKTKDGKFYLKIAIMATVFLLCIGLAVAINVSRGVFAKTANAETTINPLGYSYNTVKNKYLDLEYIKDGSPIFDRDWLDTQVEKANRVQINSTQATSYSADEFKNLSNQFTSDLGFSSNVSANVDLFGVSVSSEFNVSNSIDYSKYVSQYFYMYKTDIVRYTLGLPNYSSDITVLKNNLHTNFVAALDKLFGGTMTYEQFFDMYGTHVILKGVYGATFSALYSAVSNYYDFNETNAVGFKTKLDGKILNAISYSSSEQLSLKNVYNYNEQNIAEFSMFHAIGGKVFSGITISELSKDYREWIESINDSSAVLVGTTSDGLIPIWELLPEQYSGYAQSMQREFKNYADKYNNDANAKFKRKELQGTLSFCQYREDRYEISDKGPLKEDYDKIDISQLGYGYEVLKKCGYSKISVKVTLIMWEKHEGRQQVFLFKSEEDPYDSQIAKIQITFDGSGKDSGHKSVDFEFNNCSLDSFVVKTSDQNVRDELGLVIRYGATGAGEDTWFNEKATIEVRFD